MNKLIILLLFTVLVPLVSEELETSKKPIEPKSHNFELRFRRQSFTYIPSDLGNDDFFYRSEIKNNKVNTYIPDFQYFNNKYNFRVELSTFSFTKSNMYFNYLPINAPRPVISNRIYPTMTRSDTKLNVMKTLTWEKLDFYLGAGIRNIKKERESEYTFSYSKMNTNTTGGQLALKLQFRISQNIFLRAGIEYFRTKGDLDYSYAVTSGASGGVYPTSFKPSSTFEGTDFEISGYVRLYENLFLNVGYSEIKARNSLKRFYPTFQSSFDGPKYFDIYQFISTLDTSKDFLRGWNVGLMAQF